jgi:hypothetical protein
MLTSLSLYKLQFHLIFINILNLLHHYIEFCNAASPEAPPTVSSPEPLTLHTPQHTVQVEAAKLYSSIDKILFFFLFNYEEVFNKVALVFYHLFGRIQGEYLKL